MATIQKRLHISGLTPAITVADINARLQGFGKVLALDGFGLLDGLGEPRKFGYVTLEATESDLSRCLNLLSGTTWKGAKLRIGEAKPDYAQRLQNERKQATEDVEPPSKRRRLPRGVHGIVSNDMSIVNLENTVTRPGWHVTALSHLIRPMKMRPIHPLPDLATVSKVGSSMTKRKKKFRSLDVPPSRARVRVIDPRLFGSTHLRENMLDTVITNTPPSRSPGNILPLQAAKPTSPLAVSSESARVLIEENDGHINPDPQPTTNRNMDMDEDVGTDLTQEKMRQLNLLSQMFGDRASDWEQRMSVDGDDVGTGDHRSMSPLPGVVDLKTTVVASAPQDGKIAPETSDSVSRKKTVSRSLKDIFKPREEEGGFSLVGNLADLDLELDPTFNFGAEDNTIQEAVPVTQKSLQQYNVTLDNNSLFFFPQPDIPRAKDLFSIARADGWSFGRSGDSSTIHNRWDKTRDALSQEWKKRSREAAKSRRRRFGVVEKGDI